MRKFFSFTIIVLIILSLSLSVAVAQDSTDDTSSDDSSQVLEDNTQVDSNSSDADIQIWLIYPKPIIGIQVSFSVAVHCGHGC